MKSAFFLLLGCLLYSNVVAQSVMNQTIKICRQSGQSDTVQVKLIKEHAFGREKARQDSLREFFTGAFFKRMDGSVLKLPTRSYKDRFLKCENCEITNYSVADLFNTGQICLYELDLLAAPTEKKVFLTTTTPKGDTLSRITVLISPKMTFYLKINDSKVKIDDTTPLPDFLPEDELRIVAIAENGESMKIADHDIFSLDVIGGFGVTRGDEVSIRNKNWILSRPQGWYNIKIAFSDKDGNVWETAMHFFKRQPRVVRN